jgi:CheY-like chemotaxis protein/anti-sigma regulatory factor (Ser/Thr protein kinase)
MSHEIRTPLAAILGCADSLYRQLDEPDPKDVVRMIRDQGQLLLGILNDVLDLSKIEAGKLEIAVERCETLKILNDVYSLMHSQAVEKGIDLKTTYRTKLPADIQTDPLRVRQILINLVSNAIKFTDQGQVEIKVSCRDKNDQRWLRFEVEDTGVGITADRLATIFEAFVQDRNPVVGRRPGTGLGLTICQRLVEMLGGEIDVQSEVGKGSRFVVDLPVGDGNLAVMQDSDELARRAAIRDSQQSLDIFIPCRVLIAEDTRAVQFMLTRMLNNVVAGLTVADNGEAAVAAIQEAVKAGKPIDMVLLDMHMPVMNGYEATRKLREAGYDKPIIALTAGAMAGDRERCLQAGCTDYLPKPIDRVELLAKLDQHCCD